MVYAFITSYHAVKGIKLRLEVKLRSQTVQLQYHFAEEK